MENRTIKNVDFGIISRFFSSKSNKRNEANWYYPTPRVQSTVKPCEKLSYNETMQHIHTQLKIK